MDDESNQTFSLEQHCRMVSHWDSMDFSQSKIHKYQSGKPYLLVNNSYNGISVSHTGSMYVFGVNVEGEIGVDIESSLRKTHHKLRDRILHDCESWDPDVATLQIWTIKEAILKLIGTGLRTNMNKICVERLSPINFHATHDMISISVVSLKINGYWISIAWTRTP
jgi:phosphopantetheinyl transferase